MRCTFVDGVFDVDQFGNMINGQRTLADYIVNFLLYLQVLFGVFEEMVE